MPAQSITVFVRAVDGRARRTFKTLRGAQKYAAARVGERPDIGTFYAVSFDGIVTVQVSGCKLSELFPPAAATVAADPYADMTDAELADLANESEAAFRQAEWNADHAVETAPGWRGPFGVRRSPGCTCSDQQLTLVGCECWNERNPF